VALGGKASVEIERSTKEDNMIREPVFEDRGSLKSLLQRAAARLAARERVPDLELALIIEKHRGKALPAAITSYLVRHFRREIRGIKGPKLQSDVVKDFRFGPAVNLYDRVLPIFEYLSRLRVQAPQCALHVGDEGPRWPIRW
jgi:hypothetical protein